MTYDDKTVFTGHNDDDATRPCNDIEDDRTVPDNVGMFNDEDATVPAGQADDDVTVSAGVVDDNATQLAVDDEDDATVPAGPKPNTDSAATNICTVVADDGADDATRFAAYYEAARADYDAMEIGSALQHIRLALAVPGYGRNVEGMALYADVIKYCRVTGLNAVTQIAEEIGHSGTVEIMTFSPNGRYAILGAGDMRLSFKLWDLANWDIASGMPPDFRGVYFNNDGALINTAAQTPAYFPDIDFGRNPGDNAAYFNNEVKEALHPDGIHLLRTQYLFKYGATTHLERVQTTVDGMTTVDTVAIADIKDSFYIDMGCTLVLVNTQTGELERLYYIHAPSKYDKLWFSWFCYAPDGKSLLVAYHIEHQNSSDGNTYYVQQLEADTGKLLTTYLKTRGEFGMDLNVSFSPDGQTVMAGSAEKLWLWDTGNPKSKRVIKSDEEDIGPAFFSPGGQYALSYTRGENEINIWDLQELEPAYVVESHEDGIWEAVFSPDGRYILSGDTEGCLRYWYVDWEYEFPGWTQWDDGAVPYLRNFLALNPNWNEDDFDDLLRMLQRRGYGFILGEGVRQMLQKVPALPVVAPGDARKLVKKTKPPKAALALADDDVTLPADFTEAGTVPEKIAITALTHGITAVLEKGADVMGLYHVESEPIAGGMGRVFRVRHTGWNVDLMLKQPLEELFADDGQKDNFIRECDAWINLGLHPHIVACYYVRLINGVPAIFGEWMDGGSLKNYITSEELYAGNEKEVRARILDIAIQMARGLQYAHDQNLIHQDIKPDNILLTADGDAKVADFGIARARASLASMAGIMASAEGTIVSENGGYSPAYCSPEQAAKEPVTRRSDIWSWAVTVLEMYMGERLWLSGVAAGMMFDQYLGTERIAVLPAMVDLMRRCFKTDAAERPHDFNEIERLLTEIYAAETGAAYDRDDAKVSTDTADFLNNKALSYLDMGDGEQALVNWQKALEVNANNLDAVFNQGMYLWRTCAIDDVELLNRVERASVPNDWKSVYYQGLVQLERRNALVAVKLLTEALDMKPNNAEVVKALAKARQMSALEKPMQVYDPNNKRLITRNPAGITPDGKYFLTFAAGGRFHLSSYNNREYTSQGLLLYEADSGKYLRTIYAHDETAVNAFLFFKDSRRIITMGDDDEVSIWDIPSGKFLQMLKGEGRGGARMSLSADEKILACSKSGGMVNIWDLESGKCLLNQDVSESAFFDMLQIKDDGTQFAVWFEGGREIRFYDLKGNKIKTVKINNYKLNSVAVYPDFKTLIASYEDDDVDEEGRTGITMSLFNIESAQPRRLRSFRSNSIFSEVYPVADPRYMFSIHKDHLLRIWDKATGRCLRTLEEASRFCQVKVFEDYTELLFHNFEQPVTRHFVPNTGYTADWRLSRIINIKEHAEAERRFAGLCEQAKAKYAAKDIAGALADITQARAIPGFANDEACMALYADITRYCRAKGVSAVVKEKVMEKEMYGRHMTISANSRYAAIYGFDEGVLWDLETWQPVKRLGTCIGFGSGGQLMDVIGSAHPENIDFGCYHDASRGFDDIAFHPDGRHALIKVNQIPYKKALPELIVIDLHGDYDDITIESIEMLEIDKEQKLIKFTKKEEFLTLVDLQTMEPLKIYYYPQIRNAASFDYYLISPDGNAVLIATSQLAYSQTHYELEMIDLHTGETLEVYLDNLNTRPSNIAFSPDGNHLVCVTALEFMVWKTGDSEMKFSVKDSAPIWPVYFSPDGKYLVSSGAGNNLKLWDLETQSCLRTLKGHVGQLNSIQFTPDGKRMLSKDTKTMILWRLEWDYEFPGWTDRDDAALTYLENFLWLHLQWTEADFVNLMQNMQVWGLGYIRENGVRQMLAELAGKPSRKLPRWKEQFYGGNNDYDDDYTDDDYDEDDDFTEVKPGGITGIPDVAPKKTSFWKRIFGKRV